MSNWSTFVLNLNARAIRRVLLGVVLSVLAPVAALAQVSINIVGSDDNTAISGFDAVAFQTQKQTLVGDKQFAHAHGGATWRFSSAENLKAFQADPEKYVPAWGGHCAWAVSENGISSKKLSGAFEIIDGKTYVFSYGNRSKDGAKDDFLYGRVSRHMRLTDGNRFWPAIKSDLESGSRQQPNASSYTKSRFE